MSKVQEAKGRVDNALDRLEKMIEQRLAGETQRANQLAAKLAKLEKEHAELKRIAVDVEKKAAKAMTYVKTLLDADQR